MNLTTIVTTLKKYAPVIAAVATGIASIASKNYSEGLQQIFQALTVLFGGASMASLHASVRAVPDGVLEAASNANVD